MNSILYIDCDGVIFNTIEEAYRMMDEMNIDRNNKTNVNFFFKNVDWKTLFERACELNNAIEKIKLIKESNYYKDVIILTKLSGNYYEEGIKRAIFDALLPNVQVITLQFDLKKNSVNVTGLAIELDKAGMTVTNILHSHPSNSGASGYNKNDSKGDRFAAIRFPSSHGYVVDHLIYLPKTEELVLFTKDKSGRLTTWDMWNLK